MGYDIIKCIFIICGGRFYLNYILPTNPNSKNPIIKWLWGWAKADYSGKDYKGRYFSSWLYFSIHLVGCIINFINGGIFSVANILVNIYPMIVQLWIGYRCLRVINFKKKLSSERI